MVLHFFLIVQRDTTCHFLTTGIGQPSVIHLPHLVHVSLICISRINMTVNPCNTIVVLVYFIYIDDLIGILQCTVSKLTLSKNFRKRK